MPGQHMSKPFMHFKNTDHIPMAINPHQNKYLPNITNTFCVCVYQAEWDCHNNGQSQCSGSPGCHEGTRTFRADRVSLSFIPSAHCTLPFTFCQSVIKKRRRFSLRMLDLLFLRLDGWRMACRGIEELNRFIPTWKELRKIKYVHRGWKRWKVCILLISKTL